MASPTPPPGQRATRYDGTGKFVTVECSGCPWFASGARQSKLATIFRPAFRVKGAEGLCLWGKHLVALWTYDVGTPKRCSLDRENPPGKERWDSLFRFAEQVNQALVAPKEEGKNRAQEAATTPSPDNHPE